MAPPSRDERRPLLAWVALGTVYFAWGGTYLAIRVMVRHEPPLLMAGVRYLMAAALPYPLSARGGNGGRAHAPAGRPGLRAWAATGVVGVLLLFGGNGGVTYAETRLPSGLAAVLVATVPLWMVVFSRVLGDERISWPAGLGLVVGLAGVAILAGHGQGSAHLADTLVVLAAAASWGFGSVLGHHLDLPANALRAAAMQMLVGGAVLAAVGAAAGEAGRVHFSAPASTWLALAYLVVPGSILAFTAYTYALARLPVSTVSTYAYVNPVVAIVAGVVILSEHLTWTEGLGAVVVVGSLVLTLHGARAARHEGALEPAGAAAPGTDERPEPPPS